MQIYEYSSQACINKEDLIQQDTEPPLTECPVCRKPTFQKLLSAAGFQLKGSGWYATDFKNKSSKPAEKKSEEKKSDDKPESKSDAKPEKKTESKSEASA